MTQQEFEKLTGLQTTDAQYEVINGMYMCEDNMDKRTFCMNFVGMGLMKHVDYVVNLKVDKMELQRKVRSCEEEKAELETTHEKQLKKRDEDIIEVLKTLHDFVQMTAVYLHSDKEDLLLDIVRESMGTLDYYKELQAAGCTPTKADLEMFIKAMEGNN